MKPLIPFDKNPQCILCAAVASDLSAEEAVIFGMRLTLLHGHTFSEVFDSIEAMDKISAALCEPHRESRQRISDQVSNLLWFGLGHRTKEEKEE